MNSEESTWGLRGEQVLLGLAVVCAVALSLNGFVRFELIQLAGAALLACVAGLVWAFRTTFGGVRFTGTAGVGITLLLATGYVVGSAYLVSDGDAYDQAALFFIPTLLVLSAAVARTEAGVRSVLGRSVLVATVLALMAGLAQLAGFSIPAPVPFSTPLELGVRATFDVPAIAAVWFAGAVFVGTSLLAKSSRLGWSLVLAAALGLGLTGTWLEVGVVAAACGALGLFGLLGRRTFGGAAVFAALVMVVVCAARPGPTRLDDADALSVRPRVAELAVGTEWPYGEMGAQDFYSDAAWRYAFAGGLWGHGASRWPSAQSRYVDTDASFALARTTGLPVARRAPVPLAELWGDYGVWVPLCLLGALLWGLALSVRRGDWTLAAGTAVMAVMSLVSPGLLSPAGMVMLGVLLALVSSVPVQRDRAMSAGPLALVVVVLVGLVGVTQVQAARWGYATAAATVFLGNARLEDAAPHADAAAELQRRYASEINRSVVHYIGVERDANLALESLREAVEIRPDSVDARERLADLYVRLSMGGADADAALLLTARMYTRIAELDPNHVEVALQRANAMAAIGRNDLAAEKLEEAAGRGIPRADRARLFQRAGELYEDDSSPEHALPAYNAALELLEDPSLRRRLEARVVAMEAWIESGARPTREDDGHGH